jgi:hypothetical protein
MRRRRRVYHALNHIVAATRSLFVAILFIGLFVHREHYMSKTRKTPKPPKLPFKQMADHQTIHPNVSDTHQHLIGRVVVAWSKLEGCMQDTIWHFLRLDMSDGRIITERMGSSILLRILRALGNRHLNDPLLHEFLCTMDKIEDTMEDRNFIVHGTWGTLLPDNVPFGSSLRPKAEPGEVIAEAFPPGRMLAIVHEIVTALEFLVKLMPQLQTLPRKSDESPI